MSPVLASYVVIPQQALGPGTFKAWTSEGAADAWVAIPAHWDPAERCWEAHLQFAGRPDAYSQVKGNGWRKLVKQDVPAGFQTVRFILNYRRWRTPGGSLTSPLPGYFGGSEASPARREGRPEGAVETPELQAFRQIARHVLPPGSLRRGLRFGVASPDAQPATAHWIARRPTEPPAHLAIDELRLTGHRAGRQYAQFWTVLSDNSDTHRPLGQRVIALCRGREPADIQPMLREVLGWYGSGQGGQAGRPELTSLSMDMWSPFRDAVLRQSRETPIVFDRFHYQRHIAAAHREALMWCQEGLTLWQWSAVEQCTGQPCTCGQGQRCRQYQWTQGLHTHLNTLWSLASEEAVDLFFRDLETLWTMAEDDAWCEPFDKADYLLASWQHEVREAAVLRGQGHTVGGTGRAERVNREIRRVIALHRLQPLATAPEHLMTLLHTPVPEPLEIVAVPLADQLVCPTCGGSGVGVRPTVDAVPIRVRHLPRGLDRVVLLLPSEVDCSGCKGSQPQPVVSRALQNWLRQPESLALSRAMLRRLTGLSSQQVRAHQHIPEHQLPLEAIGPDAVVYSELRTATRAWLVLSVPSGDVIDIQHVDIRRDAEPKPPHVRVAEAARKLLQTHEEFADYQRIVMTTQTGELSKELQYWLNAHRVVLKPFIAHGLVERFRRRARRLCQDLPLAGSGHDWLERNVFTTSLEVLNAHSAWHQVQRHDPDLADAILELRRMDAVLRERDLQALWQLFGDKPQPRRRHDDEPGTMLRQQIWAAWSAWERALEATVAHPLPPIGYEPHLMRRIRDHLQTSPALDPERQRQRLLQLLSEEQRTRRALQETRRRRC